MATNIDLQTERDRATFDVMRASEFIYGGKKLLQELLDMESRLSTVKDFDDPCDVTFMSREERYANAMRKSMAMIKHGDFVDMQNIDQSAVFRSVVMGHETTPIDLHFIMFIPTLQALCSDEQLEKWLPLAMSLAIVGTYAQTELGHGTDLKNLETTATYDPKTEEFVIHTPTLAATKWWPGNLGKSTNYAIVQAQLYTKGICYGLHPFLVQIRDHDTHMPMPGICVGDIGPKLGMNSNDNGFLQFDHFRIPRDRMLMRHARIEPDGTYHHPPHEKLGFAGMVHVRTLMIRDQARALAKACTIAIRYSCVRRQGEIIPGESEVKVMEYVTQQYKLLPYLASAYAFYFAGQDLETLYRSVRARVKDGNVELLPELHAISSGLKAFVSWETTKGIEICRFACGGHGYSMCSGLPEMYGCFSAACTYEGENTVMLLQVARYLVKAFRQPPGVHERQTAAYLTTVFPKHSLIDQSTQPAHIHGAYLRVAQRLVRECCEQLDQFKDRGFRFEDAWNKCSVQLCRAAKAHVHAFLYGNFIDHVKSVPDAETSKVLKQLCLLYGLYGIERSPGKFVEDGFLSQQQLCYVREELSELLAKIRPNAVALVDAWQFSDRQLRSVLGRYDGRVYENMLKWAKESPFNKKEVMDCHHQMLGRLIRESRSKL